MAGREVREYTNLTDPKDKKLGKGKDRIDDEEVTFQRMVSKMQEVAGERGGYLHGRGAMDSDDLLYLKEQIEAEEDAERLLRHTEKRAFAAFKKAVAETSSASVPLALRVEPKAKSGIRQQDLLKRVVEVKPKQLGVSKPSNKDPPLVTLSGQASKKRKAASIQHGNKKEQSPSKEDETFMDDNNPVTSLLAAYGSSDDEN
ncbi:uncharacterized protein [Primulina eburnea]|uniref:uncharacterized protein isoform X1 n=2 Tax=Primulina eburnea TaxID=1245227 RepID=UPI003C6C2D98